MFMPKITIFKNIFDTSSPHIVELDKVLEGIKEGRWKDAVDKVRNSKDKAEKVENKKSLPAILFAGQFLRAIDGSYRTDESLVEHSGFVPFDIDNLEDVNAYKDQLKLTPYIYAMWVSPSGNGIHGLIKIGDGLKHEHHYNALLLALEGLDSTARNISRVLFTSYDPYIYINPFCDTFYDLAEESVPIIEGEVLRGDGHTDYSKVAIACRLVRNSIDGSKHNTLLKAAILLGGYISVNMCDYNIAHDCLLSEIINRGCNDVHLAKKTIEDGLKHGALKPIREIEKDLYEIEHSEAMMEEDLDFLASEKEDEDFIVKFRNGLIPMGLPFHVDGGDWEKHLVIKNEFYVTLGNANVGKTWTIMFLMFLAAVNHGKNWLIVTSENGSASMKLLLIQYFYNRKIKECSEMEILSALKWINEFFIFFDTNTSFSYIDILRNTTKYLRYKSVSGIFIDPLNGLKNDDVKNNQYLYTYDTYTALLQFSRKQKVCVILNLHCNTNQQRMLDKDGYPVVPIPASAEWGSMAYNRADNFIILHRKTKHPTEHSTTEIHIEKVRNLFSGGHPTYKGNPLIMRLNGYSFVDEFGRDFIDRREFIKRVQIKQQGKLF